MNAYEEICPLLPSAYGRQLGRTDLVGLEELRLFLGQPLRLRYDRAERELYPPVTGADLEEVLQRACRRSVYAFRETIRRGFVTLDGGHRMGICGQGVMEGGELQTIRDPMALNIRIARDVPGFGNRAVHQIHGPTLILGPPGWGKTTLLRDLVRQLSDVRGQYMGLVDERGELSGPYPVGKRTSVLRYIPKALAMDMLLRTMGPQWIAVDEITSPEDIEAMEKIAYCGVHLLATAHGRSLDDLCKRPLYERMMELNLFSTVIVLQKDKSYTIEEVVP